MANKYKPKDVIYDVAYVAVLIGILLFIALASYSPEDPNFIFPENTEIKNILGFRGSFVSDIFFQSIGLVSFLISITIFFTGINLFRKKIDVEVDLGLLIESLLVLPFALIAFYFVYDSGNLDFGINSIQLSLILTLAGPMTVIPLFFFVILVPELFRKLRETCGIHFHLVAFKSELECPSYDQKTKQLND